MPTAPAFRAATACRNLNSHHSSCKTRIFWSESGNNGIFRLLASPTPRQSQPPVARDRRMIPASPNHQLPERRRMFPASPNHRLSTRNVASLPPASTTDCQKDVASLPPVSEKPSGAADVRIREGEAYFATRPLANPCRCGA